MVALAFVLTAGTVVLLGVLLLSAVDVPQDVHMPPIDHPIGSMQILFVSPHETEVVIDGLLDLEPAYVGIPTTWAFNVPENAVLAFATMQTLQRWADDGAPVSLDLSKLSGTHPSVGFARDEVLVRLSARPRRNAQGQGSTSVGGEHP